MKWLLIVTFLYPLSLCAEELDWSVFQWARSLVTGREIEKSAIRIPVKIDSLPHQFTMQLDLGTATTLFSGNTIDPYLEIYPALKEKMDTLRKVSALGTKHPILTGINLQIGNYKFSNKEVGYFKGYGRGINPDSIFFQTDVRIGVIGTDLFQDQILIIDYKKECFTITDSVPREYNNLIYEKFDKVEGRIIIPILINGKSERVLFDTGASYFALSTTSENALSIAEEKRIDSLTIPSWGKYLTMYGHRIKSPLYIGTHRLKEETVYYEESNQYNSFFNRYKIWGLTGNKYFLESTVVIDFKNQLFGVRWEEF